MNSNIIMLIIVILLVTGDKVSTYYSLHNLQKNYPNFDYLNAEKNPLAKFLYSKMGLICGNVIMATISIGLFYLAVFLMQISLSAFKVQNYIGISWYICIMVYGFTIANNLYFALKHGNILP